MQVGVAPARHDGGMAFGQSAGPPASHTQMRRLTELIEEAGHADFRDARGPLGLNQRQAGGKFTRDEADDLIGQLEAAADGAGGADAGGDDDVEEPAAAPRRPTSNPRPKATPGAARRPAPAAGRASAAARTAKSIPTEVLAAELQRRGWVVMEP